MKDILAPVRHWLNDPEGSGFCLHSAEMRDDGAYVVYSSFSGDPDCPDIHLYDVAGDQLIQLDTEALIDLPVETVVWASDQQDLVATLRDRMLAQCELLKIDWDAAAVRRQDLAVPVTAELKSRLADVFSHSPLNMADDDEDDIEVEVLVDAAMESRWWLVEACLEQGADPSRQNSLDTTALHSLARFGPAELLQKVLVDGCDPNALDGYGQTALFGAASNNPPVLKLLLAHGANPNTQDEFGYTALNKAANHLQTECVDLLLRHGADPNISGAGVRSPLMEACVHKVSPESPGADSVRQVLKQLLDAGADPQQPTAKDKLAVDWAREFGNEVAVDLLQGMSA